MPTKRAPVIERYPPGDAPDPWDLPGFHRDVPGTSWVPSRTELVRSLPNFSKQELCYDDRYHHKKRIMFMMIDIIIKNKNTFMMIDIIITKEFFSDDGYHHKQQEVFYDD